MGQQWTSVDEKLPESKENVLAWCNDRLMVLAYGYVYEGDQNGYVWMNCYEEIDGDPYWDDNLKPTHWMPLPVKPQLESVIPPVVAQSEQLKTFANWLQEAAWEYPDKDFDELVDVFLSR